MNKITLLTLFGLTTILSSGFTFAADDAEGKNFDHGNDYEECINNCRKHHRTVLKWRRGRGKGLCWG